MAIDIKFDLMGNPEPPTIVLANRNGNKLGQLDIDPKSIDLSDKFNDASEITFTLNKYVNGKIVNLWDKVVDFKLVYCKEWDMWFEIKVELDEKTETIKTVFCTQLGQAELSQIMLYNIEINTEEDIERDDYKISILYDENDHKASILHRVLEKAPHYSIKYVDPTIRKIQRSFSFDGISIHDAFQEIAEEIGCYFDFHSNSDKNGKIQRSFSVYDLQQNCNDCGHRGEFIDICPNPKCGSKNIKYGYGEDTLIFVTADELASDGIQLTTDTNSIKNCFKLEAGDDLMTATIRNCNPNGTDYIWYFSDSMKEDMSSELVEKLEAYNELHDSYYNNNVANVDANLLNSYNSLVNKYSVYNEELSSIIAPITGYAALMEAYYNAIDLSLYLESGLMPSVEIGETDAEEQGLLLETSLPPLIAITNLKTVSLATADNAVLAMAKVIVGSSYKVVISSSQLADGNWSGNFIITNYSDEEDTYTTGVISRTLTDWDETYIRQKIEKVLSKENTDDLSVTELFEKDYDEFCLELKKYALNPLIGFHDACQACIDILIEQGVGSNTSWSDTDENSEGNLYQNLYVPYYNKLKAIEAETKIREDEISIILGVYNLDGNLTTKGLQTNLEECRYKIQEALDFENYLGSELWLEFCAYRREDKYSNENYISDGLNNTELFEKALEFYKVAENEIYKSSEMQHSISTSLNNLLVIPKFKPLVKSFKLGNWIRIQVDGDIYKLRLLEYDIRYSDLKNVPVEFSDVTKIKDGIADVGSVLSKASSMATSYNTVQRQASQGEKSNVVLNDWIESGLNATNTKIVGTNNQNQVWDKNGILCRQYDPLTDTFSDEQLKIINSTIAITDNNWQSTKTAIGKYYYIDPETKELKTAYGVNGETIVGKLLIGEELGIHNENGNLTFDNNGFVASNGTNTVSINPNDETSVFSVKNQEGNVLSFDDDGNLVIVGDITANSLTLLNGVDGVNEDIKGLARVAISGKYDDLKNKPKLVDVATSGSYNDLTDKPTKLSDFENDGVFITRNANNLENYYKKSEINDMLDSKVDTDNLSNVATTGNYNDLTGKPTRLSDFINDGVFITKDVNNLANYYKKDEIDDLIGLKIDTDNLSNVATSGDYNDLINTPILSAVAESGDYNDLTNTPTKLSDFNNDNAFITNNVDDLENYYNITEIDNLLSSKVNTSSLATVASTGSYNDLVDINELKNWILEQIQLAINPQDNS